jgi:hypothetical protein
MFDDEEKLVRFFYTQDNSAGSDIIAFDDVEDLVADLHERWCQHNEIPYYRVDRVDDPEIV